MKYHAFISYNSKNREQVRTIYEYLSNSGLRVFFDKASLQSGQPFQETMEDALRNSASILVIVGPDGIGPWQGEENYDFQLLMVGRASGRTVIPVILPGASFGPEVDGIPLFLTRFNTFAFKSSIDDKDDLFHLMRAIPRSRLELGPMERPFLRDEQERLLDRTVDFYNREAKRYFERWKETLPKPPMYAFLQQLRCPPSKPDILDAGCGPGHHANFFAEQGCNVQGIDASPEMIRIADRNKVNGAEFCVADMRDLQRIFRGRNLFDGVWACASCFHISKEALGNQLYEFLAVLKPAGVLAISMQVGVPSAIQDDGRFFERYEENELEQKLARYDFTTVNVNTQITDRNTLGKRQIKKWMNITALAPKEKDRFEILGETAKSIG
jgi:SAM-dependent methyltransferase